MGDAPPESTSDATVTTRSYQQEMLEASLRGNIIIAQDTGSGKTHVAVLRMKIEYDREPHKVSWFIAPTVALCEQQYNVIQRAIGSAGLIHGGMEPKQWADPSLWKGVLKKYRIIVSTPQVLLDALSHGYINLGQEIGLLIFDEAHHACDDHPMNCIMRNFYFRLPIRQSTRASNHGPVREERPIVLGLTASPMFGGNVITAFRVLELNLDSTIRSPRQHREQLEAYVHRPEFRYVLYTVRQKYSTCYLESMKLRSLKLVAESMDIQNDPFVLSLRAKLAEMPNGPDKSRVDQQLSKTVLKKNSYTHKGIKDLHTAANDICFDLGPWAADWYVQRVVEVALESASPYSNITNVWQSKEKAYLIDLLRRIDHTPVSHSSIEDGVSEKLRVLLQTLEEEKSRAESFNEPYSGIVFVTRRDAVLALTAVLEHHPRTKDAFRVGCLLGSSESSYRTSFLDITRKIPRQSQAETLVEFRTGDKNLIIATSVAEEGLDIQACGNVIRWDVPNNMVSWTQSRGRARRKRSSFVLMFERGMDDDRVLRFQQLERDMVAQYNTERAAIPRPPPIPAGMDNELDSCEFQVESTGALLTLQAAITHLNHFCSILPTTRHASLSPIYDIDPPDLPEGWHEQQQAIPQYQGPFGCTLTLPKVLSSDLRVHTVERIYPSKRLAYQHVAFNAYLKLYHAGLLNDHLLPLTSVLEPSLDEEVKEMLKDIEKRDGTASVTSQMNPWIPQNEAHWWTTEIRVDGLPPITLLTHVKIPALSSDELPVLYHPRKGELGVKLGSVKAVILSPVDVLRAQENTRRLFWSFYGARMTWSHLDFAYLFTIDTDPDNGIWSPRRRWAENINGNANTERVHSVNAESFGSEFQYPTNLNWIRDGRAFGRLYRFLGWHHEKLSEEEEAEICNRPMYSRFEEVRVTYPLLIVQQLPQRANFLLPLPISSAAPRPLLLLSKYAYVEVLSPTECEYAQMIPSILRHLQSAMIVRSLKSNLFPRAPLARIPCTLLTSAVTAPVAEDQINYERLESLGDAVLKFIVAVNLLATKPYWPEGYLTRRKDHVVANSRLAKEAIRLRIFRWIIRTRFSPRRFKPLYLSAPEKAGPEGAADPLEDGPVVGGQKTRREVEELSTKMLADVVESLIGSAYVYGGFDLGVSCIKLFDLGLEWHTLPECVEMALSRVENTDGVSTQLNNVERMLGYTFKHKLLLVESLTHASYQYDDRTVSYERMEFLGDALLDMIVVDYLYKYPGKSYAPHDIHIHKSAVVNTHFLAFICFRCAIDVDASMPGPGPKGKIKMQQKTDTIRLFQCLQHSSPVILEDQKLTFHRYEKVSGEIEETLATGSMFPWAALTRLQAPKIFSDIVESLIGAVYLDSGGDMDVVRELLRKLGVLRHLERLVRDDVDVLHPVSRLSVWASREVKKKIEYEFKEENGLKICTILVEGLEPVSASAEKRGHASQEEARFAAAEKAISVWAVGTSSTGEADPQDSGFPRL